MPLETDSGIFLAVVYSCLAVTEQVGSVTLGSAGRQRILGIWPQSSLADVDAPS